jgi:hypothetical protein
MCNLWVSRGRGVRVSIESCEDSKAITPGRASGPKNATVFGGTGLFSSFAKFPTGVTMKNLLLAAILGVTLLAPAMARADASEQGCKSSGEKAAGCGEGSKQWGKGWWKDKDKDKEDATTVPEPGIGILVGSGLLAVGGIVLLRRKRQAS